MDFTPKQYLFFYILVIAPIVISFFVRRRNNPTRLNLTDQKPNGEEDTQPGVVPVTPVRPPEPSRPSAADLASEIRRPPPRRHRASNDYPPPRPPPAPRAEKSLNVFFNWNGHSWDAYEVLGVPAGSSLPAVQAAYQQLLTRSGSDAHDFYKAAYDTIVRNSSAT